MGITKAWSFSRPGGRESSMGPDFYVVTESESTVADPALARADFLKGKGLEHNSLGKIILSQGRGGERLRGLGG